MKDIFRIIITLIVLNTAANAQDMNMSDTTHHEHQMPDSEMHMGSPFSLNLPMNRAGSGTSWLPDESPMYGIMLHSKKWMYMLHGNVALRYTNHDIANKGSRGGEKFDAPNWFMAMGQRGVGKKGLFHFSTMISFDRLTEGGDGYPLLFQTGESWKGNPLVDKQHPHDLFAELSVSYSYALSKKSDVFIYAGYPGEPAIGSTAFMHRPAALANPDAPIGHHWNDGTHITFGVLTLGYRYSNFKLEASSFTGREPNENRFSFDKPRFDSWSGRLSYNPSKNWALQISHAFVQEPEELHPGEDVNRTIASAIYSKQLTGSQYLNFTTLWGVNKSHGHAGENTALFEGEYRTGRVAVYSRYEWVQKSREELNLSTVIYGDHTLFPVNVLTTGLNYDLTHTSKIRTAIGGQLTGYGVPSQLQGLYGKNPVSAQVFIRIYPSIM